MKNSVAKMFVQYQTESIGKSVCNFFSVSVSICCIFISLNFIHLFYVSPLCDWTEFFFSVNFVYFFSFHLHFYSIYFISPQFSYAIIFAVVNNFTIKYIMRWWFWYVVIKKRVITTEFSKRSKENRRKNLVDISSLRHQLNNK